MKRDGKDLEELVAFVEEQLVPTGFKVTTNKKTLIEREKRILMIVDDRENRTVMEFLRGIAHNFTI